MSTNQTTVGFAPLSALPKILDEEMLLESDLPLIKSAGTDIETAIDEVLDAELAPLAEAIRREGTKKRYDCEIILYAQYVLPEHMLRNASLRSLNRFLSHALVASQVISHTHLIEQRCSEKLPARRGEPQGVWYAISVCDRTTTVAKYRELGDLIEHAKRRRKACG